MANIITNPVLFFFLYQYQINICFYTCTRFNIVTHMKHVDILELMKTVTRGDF